MARVVLFAAALTACDPAKSASEPSQPASEQMRPASRSMAPPAPSARLGPDVWLSREGCSRAAQRIRDARAPTANLRLATWNIRRFPQNTATAPAAPTRTDVEWVACAIASLDADVVAVQEILSDAEGTAGQAQLLSALSRYTKRDYRLELGACAPALPHVGILYDAARVRFALREPLYALLLGRKDCNDNLHPGVAAHIASPMLGPLLFVSVHLAAYDKQATFRQRQRQRMALERELALQRQREPALPIVVAGDFNTTGCAECSDDIEANEEIAIWKSSFARAKAPFELVAAQPGCSAYHGQQPVQLDHFLVTPDVPILAGATGRRAEVQGICDVARCEELEGEKMPAYEQRLSDHCPIVLTLGAGKR